jgi:hypothetical protein
MTYENYVDEIYRRYGVPSQTVDAIIDNVRGPRAEASARRLLHTLSMIRVVTVRECITTINDMVDDDFDLSPTDGERVILKMKQIKDGTYLP